MFICSTLASMYQGAIVAKGFRKIIPHVSTLWKNSIQNNGRGEGRVSAGQKIYEVNLDNTVSWMEAPPKKRCLLLVAVQIGVKNPNLKWEHNLLKLCTELGEYKSCLSEWEARTSIECSSRIGSHCTSCSRTHVYLEWGTIWTEWEHTMDIGVPEIPCSSWCSCTRPEKLMQWIHAKL